MTADRQQWALLRRSPSFVNNVSAGLSSGTLYCHVTGEVQPKAVILDFYMTPVLDNICVHFRLLSCGHLYFEKRCALQ